MMARRPSRSVRVNRQSEQPGNQCPELVTAWRQSVVPPDSSPSPALHEPLHAGLKDRVDAMVLVARTARYGRVLDDADIGPRGPVYRGRLGPKNTTVFRPSAAEMCAGPLSIVNIRLARLVLTMKLRRSPRHISSLATVGPGRSASTSAVYSSISARGKYHEVFVRPIVHSDEGSGFRGRQPPQRQRCAEVKADERGDASCGLLLFSGERQ